MHLGSRVVKCVKCLSLYHHIDPKVTDPSYTKGLNSSTYQYLMSILKTRFGGLIQNIRQYTLTIFLVWG